MSDVRDVSYVCGVLSRSRRVRGDATLASRQYHVTHKCCSAFVLTHADQSRCNAAVRTARMSSQ
jgi:hypothetical protein